MQDHLFFEYLAIKSKRLTACEALDAIHVSCDDVGVEIRVRKFIVDLISSPDLLVEMPSGSKKEMPVSEVLLNFISNSILAEKNSIQACE